jgi:hypothetical protein
MVPHPDAGTAPDAALLCPTLLRLDAGDIHLTGLRGTSWPLPPPRMLARTPRGPLYKGQQKCNFSNQFNKRDKMQYIQDREILPC